MPAGRAGDGSRRVAASLAPIGHKAADARGGGVGGGGGAGGAGSQRGRSLLESDNTGFEMTSDRFESRFGVLDSGYDGV